MVEEVTASPESTSGCSPGEPLYTTFGQGVTPTRLHPADLPGLPPFFDFGLNSFFDLGLNPYAVSRRFSSRISGHPSRAR